MNSLIPDVSSKKYSSSISNSKLKTTDHLNPWSSHLETMSRTHAEAAAPDTLMFT